MTCLQSVFTHKSTYPIGVKKQILSVKITTRTSCGEKASEGAYSERVLHRGSYVGRLRGLAGGGGERGCPLEPSLFLLCWPVGLLAALLVVAPLVWPLSGLVGWSMVSPKPRI